MQPFEFAPYDLPPEAEILRGEVRAFLKKQLAGMPAARRARSWSGYNPEFSKALGARGWIGMTFPNKYGGHDHSYAERYVVLEEVLAAGAPVSAHWVADRQDHCSCASARRSSASDSCLGSRAGNSTSASA